MEGPKRPECAMRAASDRSQPVGGRPGAPPLLLLARTTSKQAPIAADRAHPNRDLPKPVGHTKHSHCHTHTHKSKPKLKSAD